MAALKEDQQRLGPLEVKVDYVLGKLSLLKRLEEMMQRWEDLGKVMTSKPRREKSIIRGRLNYEARNSLGIRTWDEGRPQFEGILSAIGMR